MLYWLPSYARYTSRSAGTVAVGDIDGDGDSAEVGVVVTAVAGDERFDGEGELLAVLPAPHAPSTMATASSANAFITV
jgi:hypothetical protein